MCEYFGEFIYIKLRMKAFVFFLLAFSLFSGGIAAQTLNGRIVNKTGEPVPHAAIYIRERTQGIAADDRGEFQTTLPSGNYTLEISSLGFEKQIYPVTVDKDFTTIIVQMEAKAYMLPDVIVTNSKEDPAYAIMRKAIAKAPYYLHYVKSSRSEMYTKESVKVIKIPRLIGNMKVEQTGKRLTDYSNKLYLVEAHREINFSTPNNYDVKAIALSSTAPKEIYDGEQPSMMTTQSIYAPRIHEWVSPLAPDAFTYYKFRFESISQDDKQWVNKIRIIPQKNNPLLASGWIYIAEGTWHVMYADLTGTMFGITQHVKVNYNEVMPSAFLPTSYDINLDINVMGIEVNVKHYSSLRYMNVEIDNSLEAAAGTLLTNQTVQSAVDLKELTSKQQKAQRQLEEIATKENLNNRDAYKMAKLMQDVVEPEVQTQDRKSLEIKEIRNNIHLTIDSMAKHRDSLYWVTVRDLPLREEEIHSYNRAENEPASQSSSANQISVSMRMGGDKWNYLFGRRIDLGKKVRMNYGGLLGILPEYNFVDGFWLGQRLTFESRDWAHGRSLEFSPSAYYTTARRTVNWKAEALYRYAPIRNGELRVAGGDLTADFNGISGNSRIINSLASLLLAENRIKFYHKQFVEVGNRIDLANGLVLHTGLSYEKRNSLSNNTSFNIFGNIPYSNHPDLYYPEPAHTATTASLQLMYTPQHYYRKEGGRKFYVRSAWPTFSVHYRKAVPVFGGDNSASFDFLEAGIRQRISLNLFDNFHYQVNAGLFLSSSQVYFPDYKHFPTAQLPVTAHSLMNCFSLLNDYTHSTDKEWLQVHATYTSFYLLFKHLPFLQNYLFDEAFHLRTLWTSRKEYFEAGYSIGFGDIGRAGVFVGSDRFKRLDVGISVSLPLLK